MSNVIQFKLPPKPLEPTKAAAKPKRLETRATLKLEADLDESYHGANAYNQFLRKHGQRPAPAEAATIGTLLGHRVRANDGKLYPAPTKEQKAERKRELAVRKAEDKRIENELNLHAAVTFLARNTEDPAAIATGLRGEDFHLSADIDRDLEIALDWLLTFHKAWISGPGPRLA
jgi:hypothetical protein